MPAKFSRYTVASFLNHTEACLWQASVCLLVIITHTDSYYMQELSLDSCGYHKYAIAYHALQNAL